MLYDGDRVIGVRTGDEDSTSRAAARPTFEPASIIHAKVTLFCDGVRGNLTKTLVQRFALDAGRLPQVYALGIKELWEVPSGRFAARPRRPHDGLPASPARVRRRVHLRACRAI